MKSLKNFDGYRHQRGSTQQILVLFVIALTLVAMVMAVFGYQIGHKQGLRKGATITTKDDGITVRGQSIAEANLKQQLDATIKERDIGLSNLEVLREQNEQLTTKNLQLTQINTLLKSKIAKEGGIPLEILGAEIIALPANTFEYRFDVSMVAPTGDAIKVTPTLTLLNATSMVEIPLKPASYEIADIAYIRGRFVMPDGFSPKQIKLVLKTATEQKEQLYNWQVGDVLTGEDKGIDNRPISNP